MTPPAQPRRFELFRFKDVSGISGIGTVADGLEFPDGAVFLRWRGRTRSYSFFDSIDECISVHGHGGMTQVLWIDKE